MIKRWININNGCYTYSTSWPSPGWTIILHPKFFPFRKKWAGRVVNMQLQYMRRIKCCWEKARMGRNKNEYKLWKNSLNEKDDGYNIGTKKNGRKQKSTWSRLICRALNVSFFILDPFGWFVTVTAIGRHNIFRRKIWKAIDSARLSPRPFSVQVPRGTNPAQQALTHLVDGSVIDIPLFPTPVTHNLPSFFSL